MPQAFIFIGRSGSGKGTQAQLLEQYLKEQEPSRGITHLETGKLFREFIKGTHDSNKLSLQAYQSAGLQPEFLTVNLWSQYLIEHFSLGNHLIIDGTPRKIHEAMVLHSAFGFYGFKKPILIYVNISREEAEKRLINRGRMDDSIKGVEERLHWFETDVIPAIQFYQSHPYYTFVEVNGEQEPSKVFADIKSQCGLE